MNLTAILQTLLAVLFIAIFAQLTISVPIGESTIPITGQTFAVLVAAFFLKQNKGTLAVLLYVLLGAFGLPIFADGKAGWAVLSGGSGGFLIGFIFGAYAIGLLGQKSWDKTIGKSLLAMTIGTVIILIFGIGRLSHLYGFEKGLAYGFYPFWKGAVIKIILGAVMLPMYYRLKQRSSQ